jgi:hypothetical protein
MDMEAEDERANCRAGTKRVRLVRLVEEGIPMGNKGRQALCCCVPTPVDKEVHEVEDLLRGPSELGHAALDPDELNLRTQMGGGSVREDPQRNPVPNWDAAPSRARAPLGRASVGFGSNRRRAAFRSSTVN